MNELRENQYIDEIQSQEIEILQQTNTQHEWLSTRTLISFSRKINPFFEKILSNKTFTIIFNIYHILQYGFLIAISVLGFQMFQEEGVLLTLLFVINSIFSTLNLSFHVFDLVMKFRQEFRHIYSVPSRIYILLMFTKVISLILLIYIDVEIFKIHKTNFFIMLTIILGLNLILTIIIVGVHTLFYIFVGILFLFEFLFKILFCRFTHPCPNRNIILFLNRLNTTSQINIKAEIFKYDSENIITCIICMENLKDADKIVRLHCHKNHIFHFECINEWSKSKGICPNCRTRF